MNIFSIISAVLALAAVAIAYVGRLRSEISKHENTIAQLQQQAQSKEFQDQITKVDKNVSEEIKDFSSAANEFKSKYGTGADTSSGTSTKPDSK